MRKEVDWTACPFLHQGERARRRDPRTHCYSAVVCPEMQKGGSCCRGDGCPMAHSLWEYWLHPDRYRTQLCKDGAGCTRRVCFFAHNLQQLRAPGMAGTATMNKPAAAGLPPQATATSSTTSISATSISATRSLAAESASPVAWLSQQLPLFGAADASGSFSSPLPSPAAQLQSLVAGMSPATEVLVPASRSASFSSTGGADSASSNIFWPQLLVPDGASLGSPAASAAALVPMPQPCPPAAGAGLVSLSPLSHLAQQVDSQLRQQEAAAWLELAACRSQLQALASLQGVAGLGPAEPLLLPHSSPPGVAQLLQPWDDSRLWGDLYAASQMPAAPLLLATPAAGTGWQAGRF